MIIGTMRMGQWGSSFDTNAYQKFITQCVELGCNIFDHADIYGNYTTEAEFGNAIAGQSQLRQNLKIITKCGIRMVAPQRPEHTVKSYDSSAQHIIESVENSLRNLKTDYIDMLLLHRPDYLMNPREIAETFHRLRESGKVINFGVSNFSNSQFDLLHAFFPLVAHQFEVSLMALQAFTDGTLNQCLLKRVQAQAWSPMSGGELFAKTTNERILRIQNKVQELAQLHICSVEEILLAFLLKHPAKIQPVLGTTQIERVKKAIDARKIDLTKAQWYELYQASTGETIA